MKCPNCNADLPKYLTKCIKCEYNIEQDYYLENIIKDFQKKYNNIPNEIPKYANIIFKNINIKDADEKLCEDYKKGNISPENIVISYYNQKGYNAFFAENDYWTLLFFLIFYKDTLFSHPYSLYLEYGTTSNSSFYLNTKNINYDNILEIDIIQHIIDSYFEKITKVDGFEKVHDIFNEGNSNISFNLDEILSSICHLNINQLKLIFERMGENLEYYSKGFPDLIVYNENQLFFVEVKSKEDKPSFKQIQWHKFLSKVVKIDVVIFTIDKTKKQIDNIKKSYENSTIIKRNNKILPKKQITHLNDIKLIPYKVDWFHCHNRKYTFVIYNIKHSSGKGESKQYLEILTDVYNEETQTWDYENKYTEFLELITNTSYLDENVKIISDKFVPLTLNDWGGRKHLHEFRKIRSQLKWNNIYKKAMKIYYPNVFADYRPTKKQLERNKNAILFEEKNKISEAIKLYETNVSEKSGSPTTYKRLINIYLKFNDIYRIKEILDIAIPIFIYLNDKNNAIFFLKTKYKIINNLPSEYMKYITNEENDYIYETYCISDANKVVREKLIELKSSYDRYGCSR